MKNKNLTGLTYGLLTAIQPTDRRQQRSIMWIFKCLCGNFKEIVPYNVKSGNTRSCGCLKTNSNHITHGLSRSRTYRIWNGMHQRCSNPARDNYKYYGLLGVSVCAEWSTFTGFVTSMGMAPANKSLDRINPFGNYEPINCRWATQTEQVNNTRQKFGASEE